jgi:hypothetical protein
MEKIKAMQFVQEVFTNSFDREHFGQFVRELLNRYDSSKSQPMQVPDAFIQHVKSCQRLGTYKSPGGELLDILIVNVAEDYKIERTRTALRDFVAHKLKRGDNYKEAALVAFVPPSLRNWRFSYVRMEYETTRDPKTGKIKPEERLTPARRYSYLVGVDEKSHTAQKQLLPLLADDKQDPELSAIEQSFSVEKVTKEFFTEYSRLFEITNKTLTGLVKKDKVLRADFDAKHVDTVAFSKKLLGQIVFLYFIQKKGWLGVPKNGKWGDGPRDFLRRITDKAMQEKKNVFNDVFEPLFYDTLADDRGHDAWCKTFQCRIPFLNGGLFEPIAGYDWENTEINLPNSLFTNGERSPQGDQGTGILDVFDRYNFTVNEAEPLEKEVAIDPEMLGKVFEKLIEENRRKGLGAFYTPREIVHYMCQESLINYLDAGLNKPEKPIGAVTPEPDNQYILFHNSCEKPLPKSGQQEFMEIGSRNLVSRSDLEQWVHQSDQYAHYTSAIEAGMLKGDHYPKPPESIRQYAREIDALLRDVLICDPAIGSGAFPVGMMMEVVRARMALTPYFNDIAERTAYHFKRHAIQSSLYGVDVDVGAVEIAKLRLWLSLVVDEEDVQQIKPLPNLDYKIVTGNSLFGVEKNLFNNEQFRRLEKLKPEFFNETDRNKKAQFKKEIDDLIHELTNSHEVFDFEIYFSEVFHAKGGFDVVIANPPYLRVQGLQKTQPEMVPLYKKIFKAAQGSFDLYAIFIERGFQILHSKGHLSYIVPHKFFNAAFGKGLRELLNYSKALKQIVRFGAEQVFDSATTYTCLLFLSRKSQDKFTLHEVKDISNVGRVLDSIRRGIADVGYESAKQAQPISESWDFHIGKGGKLLEKLGEQGVTLGEITRKIFQGIATSADKIYVLRLLRTAGNILTCYSKQLDAEIQIERGLVKPFLMGKDLHRYDPPVAENVVIFPYDIKNGAASLMMQAYIESEFPLGWKYLLKNRTELESREHGRFKGCWHCFSRPQNLTEFQTVKIMTPEIALGCQMTIDSKGDLYHTTKVYSFVFNQKTTNHPLFLLGVLNSPVLWYFLKSTGYVLRGGYYTFKTDYLRPFPIACSLSKNPPTTRQESEIVELVKMRLKLGRSPEGKAREIEEIEQSINAAVYCLYGLTKEEIEIVEN